VYCTKCGAGLAQGAAFCSVCGQTVGGTGPTVAGVPVVSTGASQAWPALPYAGFWLRFVAYIIDGFVVGAGFIAIILVLVMVTGLGSTIGRIHSEEDIGEAFALVGVASIFLGIGIAIVGGWLYFAMMESSSWQATLGKRALSIQVTDMAGQRISFGRASGRHFGKIITNLIPFAIGWILAGVTEKKQALHDMIASCLVLRKAS
jgi:uncharacterized RDD family membrane protein YckC